MKRLDYDFNSYMNEFNSAARKILKESYAREFDVEEVSQQIDEAEKTYHKIQKILNAPEMIKSHAYLYALDQENVDECDRQKIDKLYDLGVARGVIQEDEPETEDGAEKVDECDDMAICGGPQDALTGQEMVPGEMKPAMQSAAYTILYSAMKDGQVKTGEYFSSAVDSDAAKADCIESLGSLGYSSIRVLGIEQNSCAVDQTGLYEDDSKEFEDQETGAGDVEKTEETSKKEEEVKTSDDGKKAEEVEKTEEVKKTEEEKPEEEKKDDKGADEKAEKPEGDDGEEKKEKLTATQKQVLRDEYVGMFKAELQRTGLEKSVDDMSIKEKADFWGTIAKKWTKEDPEEFLSDKEMEKLNSTVIKN